MTLDEMADELRRAGWTVTAPVLFGCPVVIDHSLRENTVEFRRGDKVVGKIINIGAED